MNKLQFNSKEIAKITNGKWENLRDDLQIIEFHHTYHYLEKNDAFVVISDNWPNKSAYKNNEHKIKRAIKRGISAIIVQKDLKIDTTIPILRVESSYLAMRALAIYSSKKTKAKKVLMSGSYGKTGFKLDLYNITKKQKNIYTRKNSANFTASNYCGIASIKDDTDFYLQEMPISNRDKMTRRAKLISPDIFVLTSIGHEGIERFKTIDRIIRYKLLIASALPKGGKVLLPYNDRYYKKIYKEAKKYTEVDILTYGSGDDCNARVLYEKYSEFGWDVVAKIENKVVAYRVPFFEEYAVSNSLGVLLCAYHLGFDIHQCADEYYSCKNFKSSGLLYEVQLDKKHFYLYDQCNRGGVEGYESFFKTMKYIKPKRDGKKILITSEFVDYIDGEMENIDEKLFQKIIKESAIRDIFSVEKFSEHINVLEDKTIWKNHSIDYHNIEDEILDTIQNDDIVTVKGIFDCSLTAFIKDFKSIDGIIIKEHRSQNSMKTKNKALRGLRTIEPSDIDDFKRAVRLENKKGWIDYFPFIYFWSLSSSREILIDKKDGVMNIFSFDKFHRSYPPRIQMYIPTLPLVDEVQKEAFERIYKYKGYKTANISWVNRDDVKKLKNIDSKIKFEYKASEYIYEQKRYDTLTGSKFRNLRQQLTQMSKYENISTLPYTKKYEKQCLELYDVWINNQKDKYDDIGDEKYTKNCIINFDKFSDEDLKGLVVLQDNKLISFAFVGEIQDEVLCFFIGKSNYSFKGIQSYIRHKLIIDNSKYELINDGVGISRGLDASKRMFRPVDRYKVYKGRIEYE